jgi:HK97 family phage prohead protease
MTDTWASRAWDAAAHPRAPAGSAAGGQFAAGSGGAAPTNARPVGEGEGGKRVSDLQARLNQLGFKLKVDGKFGPATLAAVRAFQKAHGLKVDGLVGPKTTAALRGKQQPVHKPAAHSQHASRALAHEKVGHTGQGLWHDKSRQLPAFVQHVANDLMESRGMPESEAIATAVAMCKKWAAGGKDVKPETRAKAAAAVAEWERLKAQARATRSAPMSNGGGYDEDGLDASWDGDHSDLPSLTGLDVGDFEAVDQAEGDSSASRAAKPGTGARFAKLKAALAAKGASDPGALAAYIGRKKYGKARFKQLANAARKRKGGGSMSRSGEILRFYQLDDIRIMRAADGEPSGRVVEAYATVFDEPAEIHDEQGHYEETIDRAAFDATLARITRSRGGLAAAVRVLYNHGKTMEGVPAPEFQKPLGRPVDVRPDGRGLLTRTEYAKSVLAEEVLELIRAGAITAQSFVGGILRSDPALRGPGDRYRARNGTLTRVRRMMLGLREYGPVLYAAYPGAEFLGVRMSIPGSVPEDGEPDTTTEDEELAPATEGDGTGGTPEDVTSPRHHHHQLLALRTAEMRREAGIDRRKVPW